MCPYHEGVTGPIGPSVGDAYIEVHADTKPVEGDIRRGLDKAGKASEPEAEKVGKGVGKKLGDGVEREVGRRGPGIARGLRDGIEREVVDIKPNFRWNLRGKDGKFVGSAITSIKDEVEQAFTSAGSGGFFSKIQQGVADAIGAGFNVSGKSPLVGALVPVIASVVALVAGLLQLVNAAAAVITTLPSLLVAVGLQAGVLFLAFKGLGGAIQGAFAATNAKELKAALEGLTPSAQKFVKSLIPIRNLFRDLKWLAQENFFRGLGNSVAIAMKAIEPNLRKGVYKIAFSLGFAVNNILAVFSGPTFKHFMDRVIPATIHWIDTFGPSFGRLLLGLIRLADTATPFLGELGDLLNSGLSYLGDQLYKMALDGTFGDWLNSMLATLKEVGPLLGAAFDFIVEFLASIDKAGGKEVLKALADILIHFAAFLKSEAGWRAMQALIYAGIAGMYVLTFAVLGILGLLALLQGLVDWLIHGALPAIGDFFTWVGEKILGFVHGVGKWFDDLGDNLKEWFRGLGKLVGSSVGDLKETLRQAGKNLITGLVNGLMDSMPWLKSTLGWIGEQIKLHKGPPEKDRKLLVPAGKAIMAGLGEGIKIGVGDIRQMLGDFTTDLGGVGIDSSNSSFTFGQNAIQINFNGALPSTQEAMATGQAVGAGINSTIAARNTRLAVRTL